MGPVASRWSFLAQELCDHSVLLPSASSPTIRDEQPPALPFSRSAEGCAGELMQDMCLPSLMGRGCDGVGRPALALGCTTIQFSPTQGLSAHPQVRRKFGNPKVSSGSHVGFFASAWPLPPPPGILQYYINLLPRSFPGLKQTQHRPLLPGPHRGGSPRLTVPAPGRGYPRIMLKSSLAPESAFGKEEGLPGPPVTPPTL